MKQISFIHNETKYYTLIGATGDLVKLLDEGANVVTFQALTVKLKLMKAYEELSGYKPMDMPVAEGMAVPVGNSFYFIGQCDYGDGLVKVELKDDTLSIDGVPVALYEQMHAGPVEAESVTVEDLANVAEEVANVPESAEPPIEDVVIREVEDDGSGSESGSADDSSADNVDNVADGAESAEGIPSEDIDVSSGSEGSSGETGVDDGRSVDRTPTGIGDGVDTEDVRDGGEIDGTDESNDGSGAESAGSEDSSGLHQTAVGSSAEDVRAESGDVDTKSGGEGDSSEQPYTYDGQSPETNDGSDLGRGVGEVVEGTEFASVDEVVAPTGVESKRPGISLGIFNGKKATLSLGKSSVGGFSFGKPLEPPKPVQPKQPSKSFDYGASRQRYDEPRLLNQAIKVGAVSNGVTRTIPKPEAPKPVQVQPAPVAPSNAEIQRMRKERLRATFSPEVNEVIGDIPHNLLAPITAFTMTDIDVELLNSQGAVYCKQKAWANSGNWYAIDVVRQDVRYFFNEKKHVSIPISKANCREWLKVVGQVES